MFSENEISTVLGNKSCQRYKCVRKKEKCKKTSGIIRTRYTSSRITQSLFIISIRETRWNYNSFHRFGKYRTGFRKRNTNVSPGCSKFQKQIPSEIQKSSKDRDAPLFSPGQYFSESSGLWKFLFPVEVHIRFYLSRSISLFVGAI